MDPLSQVFSLLKVQAARCTRFEGSGTWAYRFPAKPALKFGAVIKGSCWIDIGDGTRHALAAGDSFLLAHAPGYVLGNDAALIPADGVAAFDWAHSDVARHEGDDTVIVAGSFRLDGADAELLLDALPPFLPIPGQHPSAAGIRTMLHIVTPEIMGTQIGAAILTDRLVDVLLILVLRAALEQDSGRDFGWIGALADPKIGRAIGLMHKDAAHHWTLERLCAAVAMSRSAFTRRFRRLVGRAPLDYLLHWRMHLARSRLQHGSSVAAAAQAVGYASESAFRHAFKRVHGSAPGRCRH